MDIVDQLAPRGFDCVCGNLRMAARAVTSVYDRHLRDAGVQASQMAVLWAVAGGPGMSVKELAGHVAMDETTMIRNLRGLERQGWVRLRVGTDRRRRLATLTKEGRSVFAEALPLWKAAQNEVGALLEEKLSETNRRLVRLARSVA
ncbi:MAG: MarR family winged helix-turn-helix transcriptional regulator [Pseudomonadota bacterium]|nr:MarR family winged helix-turn-helix transcriptional regulator [Pseudomonadota bacterium]